HRTCSRASPQPRKSATDSFFETELGDLLSERGITTVVVVGAATDFCVDATVGAVVSRGLNVDLVSDGHALAEKGDPDGHLTPEQVIAITTRCSARPSIRPVECA
ncbi:MAG: isochorismatase family protein, partial [Solirubrobacteraceae bacterium]